MFFKEDNKIIELKQKKNALVNDNIKAIEAKGDYRKPMERKQINLLVNCEGDTKKDSIYQRNSGFNQVLAKIAKENNISLGISFEKLKKSKYQYQILGRMQQNYKLCQKYKVKILVKSFSQKKEDLTQDIILKSLERLLKKKKLF